MDQEIVKAFVAPAKLVWKHDLAKELLSRPGAKDVIASLPGAVTAIFTVSGAVTGRVLYVMTRQTALGVVGGLRGRWPEEVDERTIDAVAEISGSVADYATTLLERIGYGCEVELVKVIDSGGKGIAKPDKWDHATQLASAPDFDNPGNKDEIGIWFDVKVAPGSESKSKSTDSGPEEALPESGKPSPEPSSPETASSEHSEKTPPEGQKDEPLPADDDPLESLLSDIESELAEEDAAPPPEPEEEEEDESPDRSWLLNLEDEEEPDYVEAPREAIEEESIGEAAAPARFQKLSASVFRAKRVEVPDSSGAVRASVGTSTDGSPFVVLSDRDGRVRATLALAADGSPRLALADDLGKTVYEVPSPTRKPQGASRSPVRRPAGRPGRADPRKNGRPRAASPAAGRAPGRRRAAR